MKKQMSVLAVCRKIPKVRLLASCSTGYEPTRNKCIVLLANGCPSPAIVKAFGFGERTVKSWWQRAGQHCEAVHEHVVGSQALDLQHVQADETRVKIQGEVIWMAMAIMVSTRLWLGGVKSPRLSAVSPVYIYNSETQAIINSWAAICLVLTLPFEDRSWRRMRLF
jgi:hypothetical protein